MCSWLPGSFLVRQVVILAQIFVMFLKLLEKLIFHSSDSGREKILPKVCTKYCTTRGWIWAVKGLPFYKCHRYSQNLLSLLVIYVHEHAVEEKVKLVVKIFIIRMKVNNINQKD